MGIYLVLYFDTALVLAVYVILKSRERLATVILHIICGAYGGQSSSETNCGLRLMLAGFLLAQYCLQQYLGGNQCEERSKRQ